MAGTVNETAARAADTAMADARRALEGKPAIYHCISRKGTLS